MENRGRVINISNSKISDDINTEDNLNREPLSKEELDGIIRILNYEKYCLVLYTLRYLESKNDLTEADEEMIESSKVLIRRFKLLVEEERLDVSGNSLKVNINDGALKLIKNINKIDTIKMYEICKEVIGLLSILEEETRTKLENVAIEKLEELIEEYDSGGWSETEEYGSNHLLSDLNINEMEED